MKIPFVCRLNLEIVFPYLVFLIKVSMNNLGSYWGKKPCHNMISDVLVCGLKGRLLKITARLSYLCILVRQLYIFTASKSCQIYQTMILIFSYSTTTACLIKIKLRYFSNEDKILLLVIFKTIN